MTARVLALLALAAASAACGPDIKLMSPVTSKYYDTRMPVSVGLYVSKAAASHVWTGTNWLIPHRVDFGDALEANASHALGAAFDEVIVLDQFPPTAAGSPRLALALEISRSDVSPAKLTFSSSEALVDLRARLAIDGMVAPAPIEVQGTGIAAPGAQGFVRALGMNQIAHDSALQDACEVALGDALEKLVEATIETASKIPQ